MCRAFRVPFLGGHFARSKFARARVPAPAAARAGGKPRRAYMPNTMLHSHILVPVDGSEAATHAAAYAAQLARAFDARLTLVHVFDAPGVVALGLRSLGAEQIKQVEEDAARMAFAKARAVMGDSTPAERAEMGDPAEVIITVAKREAIDHIVMGSRGLSPAQELLLGSVSDRIIRHAHCPVTIVR